MTRKLDIRNREQVERINELACRVPYEVWLFTDRVMLDARSLLSLYALIGQRVSVVTEDTVSPGALERLVARMA